MHIEELDQKCPKKDFRGKVYDYVCAAHPETENWKVL